MRRALLLASGGCAGALWAAASPTPGRCAALPDVLPAPTIAHLTTDSPRSVAELEQMLHASGCTTSAILDYDCLAAAVEDFGTERFLRLLPFIIASARAASNVHGGRLRAVNADAPTVALDPQDCLPLLAAAFLCAYPQRRTAPDRGFCAEDADWPSVNLDGLFRSQTKPQRRKAIVKVAKVGMLLHYFDAMMARKDAGAAEPRGSVSIARVAAPETSDLGRSATKLGPVQVHSSEETVIDANGMLRLVPAPDGLVGGGVLTRAKRPADFLFAAAPELLLARLLCSRLKRDEFALIRGAEQFTRVYPQGEDWHATKAGRSFAGPGLLPMDVACVPVPLAHARPTAEGARANLRAVTAAVGDVRLPREVAVVPWEGTDPTLTALIAWAACSQAGKDFHFFPSDTALEAPVAKLAQQLRAKGVTVGQVSQFVTTALDPAQPVAPQARRHFGIP